MYNVAVLGDRDSVLGFKALGLEVFFADTKDQAAVQIHALAKKKYAVIYITETLAAQIPQDIAQYKDEVMPAIILIPGKQGSLGISMENLKRSVERAVGVDIFKD
ncbi:V-type ATP synthase subunit F [Anoxybacterium hadale]|uniref:V-type ATP synthase subunit F n=1 Tax=Anoxybacterium hadale TaxID=3408580 RepID=A0ACD1ACX2_9FIRM|nr:V-type ATP synthase subunit F [Clostridiales bacterium]